MEAQKKSLSPAEQERADVAEARQHWWGRLAGVERTRLVMVDECAAKANMTRLYGRAQGGARVAEAVPAGRWETTTLVGSLRLGGQTTAMVLEGALDGEGFVAYLEQVLGPTLSEGDIVVMDNLSSHTTEAAREAIEAREGRLLLLPPYSPDLNPIEKMWSKVKALLRAAKARCAASLLSAITEALAAVTPDDAHGWFDSCGYLHTVG